MDRMRERTIWRNAEKVAIFRDDVLIWCADTGADNKMSDLASPMVMRDIQPYKNMIDGRMITSRSEHRNLLKQHNCVEVGNDTSHMKQKPFKTEFKDRKKILRSQLADKSDRQLAQMVQTEIKLRKQ